jgi:hypothetical protein
MTTTTSQMSSLIETSRSNLDNPASSSEFDLYTALDETILASNHADTITGRYSQCFLWTAYIFIYILSIRVYVIALPSFFSSSDFYIYIGSSKYCSRFEFLKGRIYCIICMYFSIRFLRFPFWFGRTARNKDGSE